MSQPSIHSKRDVGVVALALALLVLAGSPGVRANEGIPEPDLILYGRVTSGGALVTTGTLNWVLDYNGKSVAITVPLSPLPGGNSYVMRVPVETAIPGIPVCSNALTLSSQTLPVTTTITLDGNPVGPAPPETGSFAFSVNQRGLIKSFHLGDANADSDNDGLDDAWEIANFDDGVNDPLRYGVDDDPDGDGSSNFNEYIAGTIPVDPDSFLYVTMIPEGSADTFILQWPSVLGKTYAVQSSTNLMEGFNSIANGIPAALPFNEFIVTTADGLCFRVSVDNPGP
jgi:hypothetical protein